MYSGGTIRPLKGGNVCEIAEAIGFHDGKVVSAGTAAEVTNRMDKLGVKYAKVGLSQGQALLPGLIEPHVHILTTAMMTPTWNDFGPFDGQNLREGYDPFWLKEKILSAKESIQQNFWILAYGVDPSLMPFEVIKGDLNKLQTFDVDTVDALENPDPGQKSVPVFMMSASGHSVYVNSTALRHIYEVNPQGFPSFKSYREHVNSRGGLQELDEILPALAAVPKGQLLVSAIILMEGIRSLFEQASKRGVTMLYDALMSPEQKAVLDAYFYLHASNPRIGYAKGCSTLDDAKKLSTYEPLTELKNMFAGSIKIVSDGSNQGLTGYQSEENFYRCKPENNVGIFNFEEREFDAIVKTVVEKKWPLMIHANGTLALTRTLEAYEKALAGESGLKSRHRIEHCSLPNEEALQKMSDLGISPSFLIGHVGYWGYAFDKGIFEENAQLLDPCQSALRKGMRVTLHTDYFVSPLGPLRMMEQAITRIMEQDPDGRVLNPAEKLTPAQALLTVTYDAAWQCHVDKWVGSLEEGKMADYVILGEDPITRTNPVGMRDIPVLETWVGGVKVFNATD